MELESDQSYKIVSLVTSEYAKMIGINAETPVFISPYATKNKCVRTDCATPYNPLVYAPAMITESHHFHTDFDNGGIYFLPWATTKIFRNHNGIWIASVSPLGKSVPGRAERVLTQKIQALCSIHHGEIINEGQLIISGSRLNPICSTINIDSIFTNRKTYLNFTTKDDQISFYIA